MSKEKVREAVYAGSFYPEREEALEKLINSYLSNASTSLKETKISGKIKAMLVPHAGYVYSGQTAGFAFAALKQMDPAPKRIVLFGPSHQEYLEGVYGFDGAWVTPLGKIKLDDNAHSLISFYFDKEHCLEVEIPFLQVVLKKFDFVPLLYGEITPHQLASTVNSFTSRDTVLIASSDLSHYFPYDHAKEVDADTIESILSLDLEKFMRVGEACGKTGIASLLLIAKKNKWKPILLDYKNSGDTAGDKLKVVGYAAIIFVE